MNALIFSSIQTAAYSNLFECSLHSEKIVEVIFSSMSHRNKVGVVDDGEKLLLVSLLNTEGLKTAFPNLAAEDGLVIRHPKNDITDFLSLLGRVFRSAATLPPDPTAVMPERTESESVVVTRLGQHRYKMEQLSSWGGACAVTGITEPALLRASHAKPWADASDAERLDPANGLPLAVHLDALFDAGLIAFSDQGTLMLSSRLDESVVKLYGLSENMKLRKTPTSAQLSFLDYHRQNVFKA